MITATEHVTHHDVAHSALTTREMLNQAVWRAIDSVDAKARAEGGENAATMTVMVQINRRDGNQLAVTVKAAAP